MWHDWYIYESKCRQQVYNGTALFCKTNFIATTNAIIKSAGLGKLDFSFTKNADGMYIASGISEQSANFTLDSNAIYIALPR